MKCNRSTMQHAWMPGTQEPAPTTASLVMKQQRLTMQHVLGCNRTQDP
jgi:hypothetical protein